MGTPNTENYTLGRGRLFFDITDPATGNPTGERPLGNAPNVTLAMGTDFLEHFSSMSGFRSKDKSVVSQIAPTISFTLDEIEGENWKLAVYGSSEDITQAAGDDTYTIANPLTNRSYDLGKRKVGLYRVLHGAVTGGPFTVGETVTGGTSAATGVVVFVGSDHLLFKSVTGGPFTSGETLTGGTSTATATSSSDSSFVNGVVAVHAATTYFTAGTDYVVEPKSGRITIPEGSSITGSTDVEFAYLESTYTRISAFGNTKQTGTLKFISDNPEGAQYELKMWSVTLRPDGELALIGDDWSTMAFVGDILRDETNHPEAPYAEVIVGY